jgi:hypothetical protein
MSALFFEPIICVPIVAGKTMNIADNSSGYMLETMEKQNCYNI